MSEVSQNGYRVFLTNEEVTAHLRTWKIPGSSVTIRLRKDDTGFVLAHLASWFNNRIEPLDRGYDDWGWSPRKIAGSDVWSNHASGTALDLNADRHPQGHRGTFTDLMVLRLTDHLKWMSAVVKWGGTYQGTPDEMHFEIVQDYAAVQALTVRLKKTARGQRLIKVNNL